MYLWFKDTMAFPLAQRGLLAGIFDVLHIIGVTGAGLKLA